ncbi:hypothetical protein ACFC0M_07150 [Streptomyces sp. NPDC056149]|uniref:hypothetical protein n=1 Tax=Streptomyces sp. NPDC056149 TaxID=3345728 RepID=UPI0035D6F4DA
MLRHAIAPARFFSQVPNEIIRHPRLSSDAVRLLTWQLSLPDGADEPLSATAKRAGIKKTAFIRAKRELSAEGYLHEWRRQGPGGRWSTTQLVSNVPLDATEAAGARDGRPTDGIPAAGEPTGRAVGHSLENTVENTPNPPSPEEEFDDQDTALGRATKADGWEGGQAQDAEEPPASETAAVVAMPQELVESGVHALAAVSHSERRLRLGGHEVRQLAPLAGEWLQRGATVRDIREALTSGLPETVHCPAALVRDRLVRKMPEAPSFVEQRAIGTPPVPRVAAMRECAGEHLQPLLFRPVADERLCAVCRNEQAETTAVDASATPMGAGKALFAAARVALRP